MLMQLNVLPLRLTADAGRSVLASDLIEKGSVACTAESGRLLITVKTHGLRKLDRIGFADLSVFQSDDGRAWLLESKCDTSIKLNARIFTDDSITADVEGGHYYRVTCTHYARGYSPKAGAVGYQNAVSISKTVWVPEGEESAPQTTSAPPQTTQPAESAGRSDQPTTAPGAVIAPAASSGTGSGTTTAARTAAHTSAAAVMTTAAQPEAVSAQPAGASPDTRDEPPFAPAAAMAVSAAVLVTLPAIKRRTRR